MGNLILIPLIQLESYLIAVMNLQKKKNPNRLLELILQHLTKVVDSEMDWAVPISRLVDLKSTWYEP